MAPFLTAPSRRSVFICTSPAEPYYMSFSHIRMFSLSCLESTAIEAVEDTLREFDDLQREVVSEESTQENAQDQEVVFCVYCRNAPCILEEETLPARLRAFGQPRLTNHTKRKGDYRAFYTLLKRKGLWRYPVYLERKEALGCFIEDVREVTPICVVEDVRKRWPNPDRCRTAGTAGRNDKFKKNRTGVLQSLHTQLRMLGHCEMAGRGGGGW